MARAAVPVVKPGSTGTTVSPAAIDAAQGMYVPNWQPGMDVQITNTHATVAFNATFVQLTCPTCGVATNKVVAIPALSTKLVANLPPTLFSEADGSLYINFSDNTGTIIAIQPG